ncbi:uncharacterized protein GGS22DRAFT_46234 [Annulohypoxylon maeteangense]|uniref:uncharacterized protein n=1 Tax=Annulohypoxylon maeteangense TaxID=1927788 RepID=UPI002008E951|nr:uncharacterized protein GGS22DRAFT_46234 [Annulohypoxylon maeteangense]KAI0882553.1 hypothetical protein GGS22DRAFT_46234 [Annulohypoxylon maeteangense]
MQFTTAALLTLLGAASAQKVHVVSVGSTNGTLAFSPDNVKADVGDMLQFQFRGGNHSVAQSNFDNPCSPIAAHTNTTGIFSGYQPVAASQAMGMIPTYSVMVSAKTPLWFYCSQAKHCQAGMVMVVNENTTANSSRSLTAFKTLAKAQAANVAPTRASGGTSGTNSTTGSTGGSTGSGSGSSGTGTTSGSGSTTSGTASSATSSAVATGAATMVGVSSSVGLVGLVAAMFML